MPGPDPFPFLMDAPASSASSLPMIAVYRKAGGGVPNGRPASPTADSDRHQCRQPSGGRPDFQASRNIVKYLGERALSDADIGIPIPLLSFAVVSVHAFTAPVACSDAFP